MRFGLFAHGGVDGDDSPPRVARQPRDARLEERAGRGGLVVHAVVAEPCEHVPEVRRYHGKSREELRIPHLRNSPGKRHCPLMANSARLGEEADKQAQEKRGKRGAKNHDAANRW